MQPKITLHTKAEVQSKLDRQRWAELLILQLPETHDGRNGWLLNYGEGDEARKLRGERGLPWIKKFRAAATGGHK